ncbi:MAG: adenylate/guanylate cyclase domain-containing protein [Planctomycetaceae bacterium]
MRMSLVRHLKPYGFFRRFPIAERPRFGPEQSLRFAELLQEIASRPADAEQRAKLLAERASIEELAGRGGAAQQSLAQAIELVTGRNPGLAHEFRYQSAKLRYRLSDLAGAQAALETLVAVTGISPQLRRRAFLILGRVGLDQGRFSSAIESLNNGLSGENTNANRVSGYLDLVYAHFHQMGREQARAILTTVEQLIEPGDRIGQAAIAYYSGWLDQRHFGISRAALELARDKSHDLPSKDPAACCELSLAVQDFRTGRLKECLAGCERVLNLTGPDSRPDLPLCSQLLRGRTLMVQGSYVAAIEQFKRARDEASVKRLAILEARAYEGLADVHALAGEIMPARDAITECLRLHRKSGYEIGEGIVLLTLASVERQSGDAEQGLVALKAGKEIARRIENNVELARAEAEYAEFCISNHDLPGAMTALTAAENLCVALGSSDRLAMIKALRAKVLSLQDLHTEALELLSEAEKLVADNQCRIFLAEILALRADVIEDGGDREGATKLLALASEQAAQNGADGMAEEFRRSSEEVREREFARGLLERYFDARVVSRLLARPERRTADSHDQVVAILFSDIRGYTSLSENLSPPAVVSLLNEHFGAMSEEVQQFGGLIDKFIGDAIMVVFGDPGYPRDDDAARAVQAAVAMVRRREEMNWKRQSAGLPPVKIGVGIHVGPVIMGHIGSERRLSYTVIGDAVNIAARLESATKDYQQTILVSEDVARSPSQLIPVKEIGELPLKGRTVPVRVFAVECDAG